MAPRSDVGARASAPRRDARRAAAVASLAPSVSATMSEPHRVRSEGTIATTRTRTAGMTRAVATTATLPVAATIEMIRVAATSGMIPGAVTSGMIRGVATSGMIPGVATIGMIRAAATIGMIRAVTTTGTTSAVKGAATTRVGIPVGETGPPVVTGRIVEAGITAPVTAGISPDAPSRGTTIPTAIAPGATRTADAVPAAAAAPRRSSRQARAAGIIVRTGRQRHPRATTCPGPPPK